MTAAAIPVMVAVAVTIPIVIVAAVMGIPVVIVAAVVDPMPGMMAVPVPVLAVLAMALVPAVAVMVVAMTVPMAVSPLVAESDPQPPERVVGGMGDLQGRRFGVRLSGQVQLRLRSVSKPERAIAAGVRLGHRGERRAGDEQWGAEQGGDQEASHRRVLS